MDDNQTQIRLRSGRPPTRPGRRIVTVVMAALAGAATLATAAATPASASTVDGIATIAGPGTTTELASGGSTTAFTVALPSLASCTGDTATGGYHVYSYLVHKGTALAGVTFKGFPSQGFGLVDSTGTYYGPANTAATTGQIIGIPNAFEWSPLVTTTGGSVTLAQLLYSGSGASASGIWEAGLVCANSSGAAVDNWNTEVTFGAKATDPNGFTWTAVPGPSGSAPAVFTSATSTTFTQGVAGTFTPTASGSPVPVITESGALPTGVTFAGGVLSGTPGTGTTGSYPVTFTATNGIGSPVNQSFTLTVVAIRILTTTLATAHLNAAYSATLSEIGGVAPIKWSTSGKLPKGLKLNKATGAVSGTVSKKAVTGTVPITFTVTDKSKPVKNTASVVINFTVAS